MAILAMPASPRFQTGRFSLVTKTRSFMSAEDGSVQTRIKPGAQWLLEAVLPPLLQATAQPWTAFLTELDGPAGRFFAGDPFKTAPLGVATGTPLVDGAAQTGTALITDGWTASTTGILLKGDMFAVDLPGGGRSLHQVTADANSGAGAGAATLSIHPAIRESPANNATIITASPTCVMRLLDDQQAGWEIDSAGFFTIAFTAIESFNLGS